MQRVLRYFRDPHLTFWTVAVLVLAALTAVAYHIGADAAKPALRGDSTFVAGVTASAAAGYVSGLESLLPSGIAAGSDPRAIEAFAAAIDAQARAGAAVRRAEGAAESDPLVSGFTQVTAAAAELATDAGNAVAATAARTRIGLAVSRLATLTAGLPAPPLPAGSGNPLRVGGQPPMPNAPTVSAPTVTRQPTSKPTR